MTFVAIVLCIVVVCLGWMQLLPGLIFARLLFQPKPAVLEDAQCPKAAVLLSVRGNDPFLGDCVASLLRQDYPTFDIRIVVDHETDPSWRVIQDIVTRMNPSNVTISVLGEKFGTCTLKPNSLLQALSQLDDSYEVIAILDSDAVTHPTWLKELVAPLQDETIGVASGNRWYMPQRATIGSLVRYTWNAAAVVQMYFGHFTWGGSVAIRGSVVRHSKLQDRWRHSIAEDTAIYGEVRASGMKAAFVPSLMIVNRESCGLLEFYVWMKRQLLVGRLQHAGWHMVFWHAAITSLLLTASVVLLVAAVATGNGPAVIWLGAGLVVGIDDFVIGNLQSAIVVPGDANEDTNILRSQMARCGTRIFYGLPRRLEQPALLWVHADCFSRRQTPEPRIEFVDIARESTPFCDQGIKTLWVGVIEPLVAPTIRWNLAYTGSPFHQKRPKRLRVIHITWQAAPDPNNGDGKGFHLFGTVDHKRFPRYQN